MDSKRIFAISGGDSAAPYNISISAKTLSDRMRKRLCFADKELNSTIVRNDINIMEASKDTFPRAPGMQMHAQMSHERQVLDRLFPSLSKTVLDSVWLRCRRDFGECIRHILVSFPMGGQSIPTGRPETDVSFFNNMRPFHKPFAYQPGSYHNLSSVRHGDNRFFTEVAPTGVLGSAPRERTNDVTKVLEYSVDTVNTNKSTITNTETGKVQSGNCEPTKPVPVLKFSVAAILGETLN